MKWVNNLKVAITGGTGLLGKAIAEKLTVKSIEYVILSRRDIEDKNVRQTNYSKESLKRCLSDCQAVVHLAAGRKPSSQISSFHNDEILTQHVYDACLDLGISNIVYASSISVYSDSSKLPWKESQTVTPSSMYGISKLSCEMLGNYYNAKHNMNIKNYRFAHLFGFNEKNNYMINLFMRKAFNKEQLTLDTQSVGKREYLYVSDAADAVLKGLNKEKLSGTFNIGSSSVYTNIEVANLINNAFDNKNNLVVLNPTEEDKTTSSYMLNHQAKNSLNYEAKFTMSNALTEIYELMKELDNVPIVY